MRFWRVAAAFLTVVAVQTLPSHAARPIHVIGRRPAPKGCHYHSTKRHGKTQTLLLCTPPPLKSPTGIAVGKSGNVWIMDAGHGRLIQVSPQGRLLRQVGTAGSGPGQFMGGNFISLDRHGNVYVADSVNNRVQQFSSKGAVLAHWGSPGQGPGQFAHPTGVAVGEDGSVYVSDTYNNRIQKLNPSGVPDVAWGAALGLHHPSGLCIDRQGAIFVADSRNQRLVEITPDGRVAGAWGTEIGLSKPDGVTVDAQDHLFVTDRSVNKVFELTTSGSVLHAWGGPGTGPGRFHFADRGFLNGIAVDAHGNIWVADTGNNRVQELSGTGKVLAVWK